MWDAANQISEQFILRGFVGAVLMTALLAILGLMPAAISTGVGSETQRPFAVVIVGGIVSATLFTLLLLPLLFPVFSEQRRIVAAEQPLV